MGVETYALSWQGPFLFEQLLRDSELKKLFSCPGVYLWKENNAGEESIAYIGKAGGSPTLFDRHLQHYMGYLGGTYTIPKEFRKSKEEWLLDISKENVLSTIFDLPNFQEVVADGFQYIKTLSIYFAPTPSDDTAKIERNLLYQINPTRTNWGTKSKPGIEINLKHSGALCDDELQRQNNS